MNRDRLELKNKQTHTFRSFIYKSPSHPVWPQTHYLSDVEQVDLQEEGCGAGGHLLGRAADGETQLTAERQLLAQLGLCRHRRQGRGEGGDIQ